LLRRNIYLQRRNFLKKISCLTSHTGIKYFDPEKIVHNDVFDDFLIDFLMHLEPIHLVEGQTL